ncbi:MAG: hypothetical protein JNL57_02920 [Bacteroidetes bacterium]|nr:hypothetical protein [Bacteroidota bacterium]
MKVKILIGILASFMVTGTMHGQGNQNGFNYTGQLSEDPDWGAKYNTSAADRLVLSKLQRALDSGFVNLLINPGDYKTTVYNHRFTFDTAAQKKSILDGTKCPTCYYGQSPASGNHFSYMYQVVLETKEFSTLYNKSLKYNDSLQEIEKKRVAENQSNHGSAAKDAQLQKEMEALQKEIEKQTAGGQMPDEKLLAEMERKGTELGNRAENSKNEQYLPPDTLRNLYYNRYVSKIWLDVMSNTPMYKNEVAMYTTMQNNPAYIYKPLNIPGCEFACIYFDKTQENDKLLSHTNPVFVAYTGTLFENGAKLPVDWVAPYCLRITMKANMQQIQELVAKIKFTALKKGLVQK